VLKPSANKKMPPPVPANLPNLVSAAFIRAKAAGDLTFFPTQVALLRVQGVPVGRHCAALIKMIY
jgi:hypothetical protein